MKNAMMVAALALGAAGVADAQRVVQHGPGAGYPPPGVNVHYPPVPPAPVDPRWGSRIGGRWWGGVNAPGGWNAYRTPTRGWRLPSYWLAPRFYVNDWNYYGLATPPQGYRWTRYYDDAVLIDDRGEVFDTYSGVGWDRAGGGDWARDDRERRDRNGVGGAIAGAVVGGIAGNVIAGRGNRLGGTLIGGGLGAAAGYALGAGKRDRDYRDAPPPPPPGAGYREPLPPPPPPADYHVRGYAPGPGYVPAGPGGWSDGRTTVTVTTSGGPAPVVYAPPPPPYGYAYGGVTTITVQTAPVVTTTTTEIVEDSVTWTRPKVRRIYSKRLWRAPGKVCACR